MNETQIPKEGGLRFLDTKFQIGEIYLMRFEGDDHEQSGWRPGLVFQNNTGNMFSPNIIALPLTSSNKKLSDDLPTHVKVFASNSGLKRDSVVLCENPTVMSKKKCGAFLTKLSDDYMSKIAVGSLLATSAISFVNPKMLQELWDKCASLNLLR